MKNKMREMQETMKMMKLSLEEERSKNKAMYKVSLQMNWEHFFLRKQIKVF